MVIISRFLILFLLWPLFLGLREGWYTLFLIMAWWIILLTLVGRLLTAIF